MEEKIAQIYQYKVGFIVNDVLNEMIVQANDWTQDKETVVFYVNTKTTDLTVAMFRQVAYFLNLGPVKPMEHPKPSIPKPKTFGEMLDGLSQTAEPGQLPENWGKINGMVF